MRHLPIVLAALLLGAPAAVAAPAAPIVIADAANPQVQALIDAGKKALADGQYEQAIANFQDADQASPDTPAIKALLDDARKQAVEKYDATGTAALAAKKYDDAGAAFDASLAILSDDEVAKKGKAAAANGPHADAYVTAAKAKLAKGDARSAVAYLEKALALVDDPQTAALLKKAKAKQPKGDE